MATISKNTFFAKLHNIVANYDSTIHGRLEIDLKDFKNDI